MESLQAVLKSSASCHHNLCPCQVLGARIGLLAGKTLGI
jgi:formylmethanofuran dehydrogenase subunit E